MGGALAVVYLISDASIHVSVLILLVWSLVVWAIKEPVDQRLVLLLLLVVGVAAMVDEPYGTDLWIYQSYGRLVEEYSSNPYLTPPSTFPDDPVFGRVLDYYQNKGSLYGPVFIGLATAVSMVSGSGEAAGRVMWQLLSFAAVLAILVVLGRNQVSSERMMMIGIAPVTVYLLINQAHNDVFVGLLILAGVLFSSRDRQWFAALSFTVAALVKAPSGIALVVFLIWLFARGERRRSVTLAFSTSMIALVAMLPFGIGAVMGPLRSDRGLVNSTSTWNLVRDDVATFLWRPIRSADAPAGLLLSVAGIVVPLSIAVFAAWKMRRRPLHEPMTVALVGWMVFSLYPSVWYTGWFIGITALWSLHWSRMLIGYASLLLVTSQAWLFPFAAAVDGRALSPMDRTASTLLGLSVIAGIALMVGLIRSDPVPTSPSAISPGI